MKIPGLTPSRKKRIVDLLKKNSWYLPSLKKLGFKKRGASGEGCQCVDFYYHPKWKFLVKESYFVKKKPVKLAIPTVKLKNHKNTCAEGCCDQETHIVIQPLADTEIWKYTGGDNHPDNMAVYKGRLVMIDW